MTSVGDVDSTDNAIGVAVVVGANFLLFFVVVVRFCAFTKQVRLSVDITSLDIASVSVSYMFEFSVLVKISVQFRSVSVFFFFWFVCVVS